VRFRFGNADATVGHGPVREGLSRLFGTIKGIEHHFQEVWEAEESAFLVIDVVYTLQDGQEVCIPSATLVYRRGALVDGMQIFTDITPVFG
jgi:hypothetical protein